MAAWLQIFTDAGYMATDNRDIEDGVEKIAIYVDLTDMSPSHVAICDGRIWKSKLGKGQDIEHASLAALEGEGIHEYGIVDKILSRPFGE